MSGKWLTAGRWLLPVVGFALAGSLRAQDVATPAATAEAPPTVEAPPVPPPAPALTHVLVHTSMGDIRIALEKDRAPITVRSFLRYVDQKRMDGIDFYRVVRVGDDGKYGLVQGGVRNNPKLVLKPIEFESPKVTGISHLDGTISMAMGAPGTATGDFFIVVGDLNSLDGNGTPEDPGFAAFGRVVEGMDVVRAILAEPQDPNTGAGAMKGQMLAKPVKILTVRRAD